MLVELSKVAVTHDVKVLELAFRYLERLKQIWEHDVMGLQAPTSEPWQQGTQPVAVCAAAPSVVAQRSAYSHASPLGARRTVSV
jgi:hypothetical protein